MLNLKKLGEHDIVPPTSFATCVDFVAIWGADPNRAQLGRLCAGAIAVCVDHAKVLPAYRVADGDPVAFGHKIMDRLFAAGVSLADIYDLGSQCLVAMASKIPKEEDIEDRANFT
jgi:hypothetical protein